MVLEKRILFGGRLSWKAADWTSSDDRVRGGKSHSNLDVCDNASTARFHGNLDIKTLGGAGFASQRTAIDSRTWNIEDYDGIQIEITDTDCKRYTFSLKDQLLPPDPNTGREQSTISYEYDFVARSSHMMGQTTSIFIPWKSFRATYRGRDHPAAPPLNLARIKRFAIMMRSFFGNQQGNFSLTIKSISVIRKCPKNQPDAKKGLFCPDSQENLAGSLIPPLRSLVLRELYGAIVALLGLFMFSYGILYSVRALKS